MTQQQESGIIKTANYDNSHLFTWLLKDRENYKVYNDAQSKSKKLKLSPNSRKPTKSSK